MDQGVFGVRGQDGKVQTRPEASTNAVQVGITWMSTDGPSEAGHY